MNWKKIQKKTAIKKDYSQMRQFIVDKNPDKSGLLYITGKDFKYLFQVLRVKIGDMVNVRLPDGDLKNSTVAKIDEKTKTMILQLCADTSKSDATITRGVQADEIEATVCAQNEVEYWLFQFIPKPQKLEQIVKQATECGVKRIIPVIGEYSDKNSVNALLGTKKERLERIIKEARQQSGSPVNTTVDSPVTLEEAVSIWNVFVEENKNNGCALGFVLSERDDGKESIRKIIKKNQNINKICIACGSEGGISPNEVDFLVKKGLFSPIHFSVNILRCETAALYGIAAVQVSLKED